MVRSSALRTVPASATYQRTMVALSAPMNEDFWTRLDRVVAVDEVTCACSLIGSRACTRHVDPPDDSPASPSVAGPTELAGTAVRGRRRLGWRSAAVLAVAISIGAAGVGAVRAAFWSDGGASAAAAVRPVSLVAVADGVPPASSADATGVELPPMSLSTPARLALLGAVTGCLVGGLCLGLTRRERPARRRRVRPMDGRGMNAQVLR